MNREPPIEPRDLPADAGAPWPRRVSATRALAWYAEAMRLWKLAPFTLCALGFLSLACELLLQLIPDAGMLASKIVAPVVTCGLYIATHAVATGGRARVADALKPFAASASAIAAIIVSSLVIFAAEALTAYAVAGSNLLRAGASSGSMSVADVMLMFAAGVAASLPFTLVALCALLDGDGFARAFRVSIAAFAHNVPAFVLYGVLSYALLLVGMATSALGLVIVLPLWATSAYAAWRDLLHPADAR
ncbi:MAG TPA: hypothetical protein VIL19_04585 [Casimicrobiaceae bacterium]